MRAFAIKSSLLNPEMSIFHYLMFHGQPTAKRSLQRERNPRLGDDLSRPLYLERNGHLIPQVFEPLGSLVVSEEVKSRLIGITNITFLQVVFHKIVDFPSYSFGDFSFEKNSAYKNVIGRARLDRFLDRLPDVPAMHEGLGNYYELIVPRLGDLVHGYTSLRRITCRLPFAAAIQEIKLSLSTKLLKDYPIIWDAYYVFNEDAFERISPHLDRNYFGVAELKI